MHISPSRISCSFRIPRTSLSRNALSVILFAFALRWQGRRSRTDANFRKRHARSALPVKRSNRRFPCRDARERPRRKFKKSGKEIGVDSGKEGLIRDDKSPCRSCAIVDETAESRVPARGSASPVEIVRADLDRGLALTRHAQSKRQTFAGDWKNGEEDGAARQLRASYLRGIINNRSIFGSRAARERNAR